MYLRESERKKREAAIEAGLALASTTAWGLCADASRVLLQLLEDHQFQELIRDHPGLCSALPASLAPMMNSHRVDAVLNLMVARTTMKPLLSRVEVLGWLARAHPQSLMTLLKVIAPAEGNGAFSVRE